MCPTLLKLGPFALHTYGLLLAIGFLLGLYMIQRDAKRVGLDPQVIGDMAFWTLLVSIVGARIRYIIMFPEAFSWSDPIGWIAIWQGGLVFEGGLVAGLLFCLWYVRRKKLEMGRTADVIMPYLPLGHAIGRLGCFLGVGCCYGKVTDVPWGVRFPRVPQDVSQPATGSEPFLNQFGSKSAEHWSMPVHPTQLYEAVGLLIICGLLLLLRKRWHPFAGFTAPLYLVFYGTLRFIVEFFRGDHNPTHLGSLSDQQVFSLLAVLVGIGIFLFSFRRRQTAPVAAR